MRGIVAYGVTDFGRRAVDAVVSPAMAVALAADHRHLGDCSEV